MDDQHLLEENDASIATNSIPMQSFNVKIEESSITKISSDLDSSITSDNRPLKKSFNRTSVHLSNNPGLIIMPQLKAHKLGDRYRYHAFIVYHSSDRSWVMNFVKKLESAPLEYKCCIDNRDFSTSISEIQNIVCSLILSERVLLILSDNFLMKTWTEFEEIFSKMIFNSNQLWCKLLGIWIDEPKHKQLSLLSPSLKGIGVLYSYDENFWQILQMSLRRDPAEMYGSSSTLWSLISQTTPLVNGQIMYLVKIRRDPQTSWTFQPDYHISIDCSPQSGPLQETAISELVSEQTIELLIDSIQTHGAKPNVCQDSKCPTLIIGLFMVIWFIGFMVMIFKLPDSRNYTLPVRLCVFIIPALLLLLAMIQRWRQIEMGKTNKLRAFYKHCSYLNELFYRDDQTMLVTVDRNRKLDTFIIYLVYYSLVQCMDHLKHLFKSFKEEDTAILKNFLKKISHQTNINWNRSKKTNQLPLYETVCLALSTSYLHLLLTHRLPLPAALLPRHTRKHLCLCQYTEDILSLLLLQQPRIQYSPIIINYLHPVIAKKSLIMTHTTTSQLRHHESSLRHSSTSLRRHHLKNESLSTNPLHNESSSITHHIPMTNPTIVSAL